jgi:hypothetical protein
MSSVTLREASIAMAKVSLGTMCGMATGHYGLLLLGGLGAASALVTNPATRKVIEASASTLAEIAGEAGLSAFLDREHSDPLQPVLTKALKRSLQETRDLIRADSPVVGLTPAAAGSDDWFDAWLAALEHKNVAEGFSDIPLGRATDEDSKRRLRDFLIRLYQIGKQGKAPAGQKRFVTLRNIAVPVLDDALLDPLSEHLAVVFMQHFKALLLENPKALNSHLIDFIHKFDQESAPLLRGIADDTRQTRESMDQLLPLLERLAQQSLVSATPLAPTVSPLPDAALLSAGLAQYCEEFRNHFKYPKLETLNKLLDPDQTVDLLPELSATVSESFSVASDPALDASGSALKPAQPSGTGGTLDLSFADMLQLVTTHQVRDQSFKTRGYVMLGEAGLGKSSLLRRLAIESIGQGCIPILIDWPSWLDYISRTVDARHHTLAQYIESNFWIPFALDSSIHPLKHARATNRKTLLILDGWDEADSSSAGPAGTHNSNAVDDQKLSALRTFLEDASNANTSVIVGSRPVNRDLFKGLLVRVDLGRIPARSCIRYIRHHAEKFNPAAFQHLDTAWELAISSSPYIGNGLLLTLVAFDARSSETVPTLRNPASTFERYFADPSSKFFEVVLRDSRLDPAVLPPLFQLIAFHVTFAVSPDKTTIGRPVFPRGWVDACARYLRRKYPEFDYLTPKQIADLAIKSSGILTSIGDTLQFSHALFQEFYCGRALAEYQDEPGNELLALYAETSQEESFLSPVIPGQSVLQWYRSRYTLSCFESFAWKHQVRSLQNALNTFVQPWETYIDTTRTEIIPWDVEYALKLITRVADLAYVPLLASCLRLWRNPETFPRTLLPKLYPYNAIAQLCVFNNWDDHAVDLLADLSIDDIQLLLAGITQPVYDAFPQEVKARLCAALEGLLNRATHQNDDRKYPLLEIAAFLEDYIERTFHEPLGLFAAAIAGLPLQRSHRTLRLFAVTARSNRFSAALAPAAESLLGLYLDDASGDFGQYAPDAFAGCIACLATASQQGPDASTLVLPIDEDGLRAAALYLNQLAPRLTEPEFRSLIAALARVVPLMQEIVYRLSGVTLADGVTLPADELHLTLADHEEAAWLLL